MAKATSTKEDDVRVSVASLYSTILRKREEEKARRHAEREVEKEQEKAEEESKYTKADGTKMSKKERRQVDLQNWREVIVGLTGDDLEYSSQKKPKKKKYKKWISDDTQSDGVTKKPKKPKKKNYRKEFDPELNMLKTLVADQNRFTADLQKRFNYAVGPASKDAVPLNKTMVELASAINVSRGNALSTLRTIGDFKKAIAQLYHKQAEIDMKKSGSGSAGDVEDRVLRGATAISAIDGLDNPFLAPVMTPTYGAPAPQSQQDRYHDTTPITAQSYAPSQSIQPQPQQGPSGSAPIELSVQAFDPNSWEGPELIDKQVLTENTPHEIVVFRNQNTGEKRFAAIDPTTHQEIPDFPVPQYSLDDRPINEKDKLMKGHFDDSYKVIDI